MRILFSENNFGFDIFETIFFHISAGMKNYLPKQIKLMSMEG